MNPNNIILYNNYKLLSIAFLFFVVTSSLTANDNAGSYLDKSVFVEKISVKGNFRTKRSVIMSELLFKEGDYIALKELSENLNRSKENINNTLLFNYVDIVYDFVTPNSIEVQIKVEERWYLWVFPLFEAEGRNFADFLRVNDGGNFNYGLYLKHNNFVGRKTELRLRFITGYKTQAILEYRKPALNQNSGWGAKMIYQYHDKIAYSTLDDRQIFLKTSGKMLLREVTGHLYYYYRYNLDHRHSVEFSVSDLTIADTLSKVQPDYLINGELNNKIANVKYGYNYDKRDSKIYPLSGYDLKFNYAFRGMPFDGSYSGFTQMQLEGSYQQRIYNRFYGGSYAKLSLIDKSRVPYYFKTGMGYEEYINGFEYNVIDGNSFALVKNKMLFELIERKDYHLNWMPIRQFARFYYSLFFKLNLDLAYVNNKFPTPENYMSNDLLIGYGVGLDFITIYDQVWSLNYSFNNYGIHGIYFHFNITL